MGVAVERDQFPAEVDGFLGGGQGFGAAAGLGEADGEVVDRPGEVGEVGVAVERDQLPAQVDGFLGGGQGLGAAAGLAEVGEAVGEVVDRPGEVGEVGVAVERDQLSVEVDGFPGGGGRRAVVAELVLSGREVQQRPCQGRLVVLVVRAEKVMRADLNGGLFELPAGTMQLAVGASYRKEYTHSNVDTSLLINPGDRQLRARQPVRIGAAGRLQRQGSLRRVVRADPEGYAVRPRVEPDDRRPLLEVQHLRQHEQLEGRARVASDRRPAAARHGLRSVPCADRRRPVRRPAASDAPKLSHDPCDHYTGNPANPACVNVPTDGTLRQPRTSPRAAADHRRRVGFGSSRASRSVRNSASRSTGASCMTRTSSRVCRSARTTGACTSTTTSPASARRACSICAAAGQLQYCPLIHRYRERARTRARSATSTSRPATSAASMSRASTSR